MKIAVCIKRVADSEARVKIGSNGTSIDETGVKFVLNPYDEFAVEEALKQKETAGEGEVVAVSVGTEASQETIRAALAMGADRGILLKTDLPADPLAGAQLLAGELGQGDFDLIVFGKMAIDDSNHAMGPMVAELLHLPCVTSVSRLALTDGRGTAEREIEGGMEVVEFALPAVLTAEKGLNEPRYPALRGIMLAKKKPLEVKDVQAEAGGIEVLEMSLPAERQEGRIVGEGADAVPALIEALRNEAKVL